jgi:hypothetical protein
MGYKGVCSFQKLYIGPGTLERIPLWNVKP